MKTATLFFFAATLFVSTFVSTAAVATPSGVAFQGRLAKDGTAISGAVTLTLTVTSPNADLCTLFEETHTFTIGASDNGVFSVAVGSGTRTANDEGLTLTNVFSNTGTVINSLACSGSAATSYTPLSTHARYIYVSFNTTVGTVAFADPYVAQSVPYALESEKLAGKTAAEYLQTTVATTQAKIDAIMATVSYAELLALIAGTSSQYVTPGSAISTTGNITQTGATTVSTGTGAISLNGATTIAANRNFSMASGTGTFAQTYTGTSTASSLVANSVTASAAQSITANALTSGSILSLTSNSTAASAGNKGLEVAISGANGSAGVTRTGISSSVTSTGGTSTNVGGYFSASGGTNNYGLIVDSGNVGIGTTSPTSLLELTKNISGGALGAGTDGGLTIRRNVSQYLSLSNSDFSRHLLAGYSDTGSQKPMVFANLVGGGAPTSGLSDFQFASGTVGGVINTLVTIQSGTGNVGIGATNPGYSLDLASTARSKGGFGVQNATGNIFWTFSPSVNVMSIGGFGSTPAAGPLSISNLGNVGIGVSTPQSLLQVNGYLQLALTAGAPPAGDCDAANERGRMMVDSAAGLLYICVASGWVTK